jgi:hypothetical protein
VGKEGRKIGKPEQFQLLAMAVGPVATLIVVVLGIFASNHHVDVRIGDLQRFMEARFADFTQSTNARLADLTQSTTGRFTSIDGKFGDLKEILRAEMRTNQSELLAKFAELDNRLARIENERRIV